MSFGRSGSKTLAACKASVDFSFMDSGRASPQACDIRLRSAEHLRGRNNIPARDPQGLSGPEGHFVNDQSILDTEFMSHQVPAASAVVNFNVERVALHANVSQHVLAVVPGTEEGEHEILCPVSQLHTDEPSALQSVPAFRRVMLAVRGVGVSFRRKFSARRSQVIEVLIPVHDSRVRVDFDVLHTGSLALLVANLAGLVDEPAYIGGRFPLGRHRWPLQWCPLHGIGNTSSVKARE